MFVVPFEHISAISQLASRFFECTGPRTRYGSISLSGLWYRIGPTSNRQSLAIFSTEVIPIDLKQDTVRPGHALLHRCNPVQTILALIRTTCRMGSKESSRAELRSWIYTFVVHCVMGVKHMEHELTEEYVFLSNHIGCSTDVNRDEDALTAEGLLRIETWEWPELDWLKQTVIGLTTGALSVNHLDREWWIAFSGDEP